MTISLSAFCPKTGQFGIIISSSSIAVGQRCPWIMAGVGAVSSQNVTLPGLGSAVLEQLNSGRTAEEALALVMEKESHRDYRQVSVIDKTGNSAVWNGKKTLGIWQASKGKNCVAAGNMLANSHVIETAITQFMRQDGELAERLLSALGAAIEAGGEAGPLHSAALIIYGEHLWPLTDLRIDWSETDPAGDLRRLWEQWQPQQQDYLVRALDPTVAPRYGVPGNE